MSGKNNRIKKPAVFLDRDGVLTVEKGYVCSKEELEIFPYVKNCVDIIHQKNYYAIVITNQSGIARGYFNEEDMHRMNTYLQEKTGVDNVYYCPHYEQGIVSGYSIKCRCRKPDTGMIQRACREYQIDMLHSYVVGDRASDIRLGKNLGVKTVLLETGYGTKHLEETIAPDFQFDDLTAFVKML